MPDVAYVYLTYNGQECNSSIFMAGVAIGSVWSTIVGAGTGHLTPPGHLPPSVTFAGLKAATPLPSGF